MSIGKVTKALCLGYSSDQEILENHKIAAKRNEITNRVKAEKIRQDELHGKATDHFNEASKAFKAGDEKKFNEEQDKFVDASKQWVSVSGLLENGKSESFIKEMAEAEDAYQKAKTAREVAKEKARALCEAYSLESLSGSEGTVNVKTKKGSRLFDKESAREFMTANEYDGCFYTGKSSIEVKFHLKK